MTVLYDRWRLKKTCPKKQLFVYFLTAVCLHISTVCLHISAICLLLTAVCLHFKELFIYILTTDCLFYI